MSNFVLKYREYIDTDCQNENNVLKKKAIKIDGNNSLKMEISCGELKSCDYIKYKKFSILYIEISDLPSQYKRLLSMSENVSSDIKKQLHKDLRKKIDPRNIIREELREKFIQTEMIIHNLNKTIKFRIDKSKVFIIAICSNNISDVMAFQYIVNDLKSSLKGFLIDVKIIPKSVIEEII